MDAGFGDEIDDQFFDVVHGALAQTRRGCVHDSEKSAGLEHEPVDAEIFTVLDEDVTDGITMDAHAVGDAYKYARRVAAGAARADGEVAGEPKHGVNGWRYFIEAEVGGTLDVDLPAL